MTIETVDRKKIAKELNKQCTKLDNQKLEVFVQINTSLEETKSGVSGLDEAKALISYVVKDCPNLSVSGLMCIGQSGSIKDFEKLVDIQQKLLNMEILPKYASKLSMGMSSDYPEAIASGSTHVRVGSKLFGARDYSKKTSSVA